ncbi:thiamine pyrophosphate-dependent acetolactate synthase large subunit-like protein [Mycobacterium sp. AZCC_0083]|nr:thiamine pyrophosphate-dependent acetolactate synthase large subunit-like protein [Mycobacterium sp. AZCC_0083]
MVVNIIGDGAWHYSPTPAALGFSQEYGVPLLIVLCNNRQYASQTWNVLKYFPDGAAVTTQNIAGDLIEPAPDYVKQAEAYGGRGQRVQTLSELTPALQRAVDVVASGRTFLLDVAVNP